jgi:hypothetical protein
MIGTSITRIGTSALGHLLSFKTVPHELLQRVDLGTNHPGYAWFR